MINLLIFGPPYSGKGTQGIKIAEKYSLLHLSTGEILRIEAEKKTELGLIGKSYTDQGLFAPNELVVKMMESIIKENLGKVKGFLFDGFPRTVIQAQDFENVCQNINIKIDGVIGLHVNESELIKRAKERAKISNRVDDKDPVKRLQIHNELSTPLEQFYKDRNIYYPINGEGAVDDVHNKISDIVKTIMQIKIFSE